MKLLLTSDGITNKSIANALFELAGKPADEIVFAFIPTAMNAAEGDKGWYAQALYEIKELNFKKLDIVDISALPKEVWQPKLEEADVLFFCGGNSTHLMYWIKKSGLIDLLPKMLETKVYAGFSAGSTITGPDLALASIKTKDQYKISFGYESEETLRLVDFYVQAHMNSDYYPDRSEENMKEKVKGFTKTIYAIDRQSALKVVGKQVEVVSEGKYLKFN